MAHPLWIQVTGAIYHAMARGTASQGIFRDERDYGRFFDGVQTTVDKHRTKIRFQLIAVTLEVPLPLVRQLGFRIR